MKNHSKTPRNKRRYRFLFLISIITVLIGCVNNQKSSQEKQSKSELAYSDYRNHLTKVKFSPQEINIRKDATDKLNQNTVYKNLVLNKEINQKFLVLLQTIGEGILSFENDNFSLSVAAEEACKRLPDGLPFVVNVIRLGVYGGIPDEILEVYSRYQKEFGIYGHKGDVVYTADGRVKFKLDNDFSIAQTLAIIDNKNNDVLDSYYQSINFGFIRWPQNPKSKFEYLSTQQSFNNYLKSNYPESKYYVDYDLEISAKALHQAYDDNEIAADKLYKNKKLAVTGTINDIGIDVLDNAYITLKTESFGQIQCFFRDKTDAENYQKGIRVNLVGQCSGKTLGNVLLQDCKEF